MKLFLAALILVSTWAFAQVQGKMCPLGPIRIAVIDTGFGYNDLGHAAPLCKYGHKDFSADQKYSSAYNTTTPVPVDLHSHGTNIVGLIDQYAHKGLNRYCFVIIKYYSEHQTGNENERSSIAALQYANNLKVEVVNYSGGGNGYDLNEFVATEGILNRGGLFVAAAGNEGREIDPILWTQYPALYDPRIKVVGNLGPDGKRVKSSNYGSFVNTWEYGVDKTAYGITMTGTSQATAIVTGKRVAKMSSCDK